MAGLTGILRVRARLGSFGHFLQALFVTPWFQLAREDISSFLDNHLCPLISNQFYLSFVSLPSCIWTLMQLIIDRIDTVLYLCPLFLSLKLLSLCGKLCFNFFTIASLSCFGDGATSTNSLTMNSEDLSLDLRFRLTFVCHIGSIAWWKSLFNEKNIDQKMYANNTAV